MTLWLIALLSIILIAGTTAGVVVVRKRRAATKERAYQAMLDSLALPVHVAELPGVELHSFTVAARATDDLAVAGDAMTLTAAYDAAKTAAQAGDAMTLETDAVDADALATDAVVEIAQGVNSRTFGAAGLVRV